MTLAEPQTRTSAWDELLHPDGSPRPAAAALVARLRELGLAELKERQVLADLDILTMGITFTVYSDGRGIDRAWPFDVIPRVIDATEWHRVEIGLVQRLSALNQFIDDLYNEQQVVRDGVFPADLLERSVSFRAECRGVRPAHGVWAHVCGTDLVRDADGTLYVLEDNLRVPSGVSYLLENRQISKRAFADLFERQSILPVDAYTDELYKLLSSLAPTGADPPCVVVLTPGVYNSAYFEHSFLAQRMGVELVEGSDLVVGEDDCVYMRTIAGLHRVDVIYRRIDDLYLDPEVFRADSALGVPGLMRAWRAGNVALANAPGAGVADDKVVYAWVPELIRYYLGEEPLLPNVPTFRCYYEEERRHVVENLRDLVVKPANESGGYGLLIGRQATAVELAAQIAAIEADPRNWVAQPTIELSTVPTVCDEGLAPRHVDLRPFILSGRDELRDGRWSHTCGATRRILGGELVAGRREQGHLDRAGRHASDGRTGGQPEPEPAPGRLMLLSRVAEHLYWAARYLERAEDTSRIIRSYSEVMVDLPVAVTTSWEPLLAVTGSAEAFDSVQDHSDESSIMRFLVAEPTNSSSVLMTVTHARENLRSTREVLPREAWQAVNDLYLYVDAHRHDGVGRRSRGRFLERVVDDIRRTDGILAATMSRDAAYEFLGLGRALERADMTTRVLGVRAAALMGARDTQDEHSEVQWMGVLSSLSARQMYHRTTRAPVDGPTVVRFLLTDEAFPRSVASCLTRLAGGLRQLPHGSRVLPAVDAAETELAGIDPSELDGKSLDHAMDGLQLALGAIHDEIVSTYLLGTPR